MSIIEHQKTVADEVYSKLQLLSPSCLLAGGAPRDWYLGKEATDLDFYFQVADDLFAFEVHNALIRVGFDGVDYSNFMDIPLYESMDNLVRIFNVCYGGVAIQLIQVDTKPYCSDSGAKVQQGFNNTLSKVWYHDGKISSKGYNQPDQFSISVKHKMLGVTDFDAPNIKKTKEKFPDYKLLSMEEFRGATKVLSRED